MIINFLGNGSFKIQTGGLTILTEPFSGELSNRLKPDILIRTKIPAAPIPHPINPTPFIVDGPGEYEIKGVNIIGLPGFNYLIKAEEINIGFIGPAAGQGLPAVSVIDVLFIPAGGEAIKTIKQLEPKIVIPSAGKVEYLMDGLDQKCAPQEKLTLKKKDLLSEGLKLICLSAA